MLVISKRLVEVNLRQPTDLTRPRDLGSPGYLGPRDGIFREMGMTLKVGE